MATYGGSSAFQPPTQTQKAEAQAKLDQARQENQAVQQQRQQAPSSIKAGSPEDIAVRAEAAKAEQQRMVEEHVSREGSSSDRFTQAREQALRSGSFSYGSFGTPIPNSFVTSQGQRIERPVLPMTQGRDISTISVMRTPVTPSPAPKPEQSTDLFRTPMKSGTSPVIRISQAQLMKTNTERASQGLPPLEQVATVQVVSPTKGPTAQAETTTLFGKTFQTFTPTSSKQSGEVSSFLKVPFIGTKAQGGEVPPTSLADIFAFVPIGSLEKGAVSAGKELTGLFTRAFSKEVPIAGEAVRTGTSDIGLNVPKYTEKFRTEKNIQSMIEQKMKTPPRSMAKQGKEPTPTPEITVSLGRGTGKVISGERGSTGILEGTGKPPTTPTEKTVSAGKGLEQIVREKTVAKTVQRQKPEFEQKQLSKQEQFLKDQEKAKTEQVSKTEEQLAQKQEQALIQRTGLRYIKTGKQEQKQTSQTLITIPKPKQTTSEKTKPQPVIPLLTLITSTAQGQKQKQEQTDVTDLLTVTKIPGKPPSRPPSTVPTPPPPRPTPTETPPPGKKTPPDLGILGVGAGSGLLGKVSKTGQREVFTGNVPTESIVGVYNRADITYGKVKESSTTRSAQGERTLTEQKEVQNKGTQTFFRTLGRGDILTNKGEILRKDRLKSVF